MAECSYARCIQERRFIKRELMKWTKDMVYIVGLERVAEELMGRRKWKLYQEVLARSQLNVNAANLVQNSTPDQSSRLDCFEPPEKLKLALPIQPQTLAENHLKENEVVTIKNEISENTDEKGCAVSEKGNLGERLSDDLVGNSGISITNTQEVVEEKSESPGPIDWKPTDKCYFCVDGKLLTVNDRGDLVAESGPAQSEAELANRASLDSDSDSSDSSPEIEVQTHTGNNASKSVTSIPPNMTSLESMAVHLAAVAQIQGIQPITSFYPGLWYHQLAQQVPPATPTTSETNVAALSPSTKESPSPSDITGEQPLDLSAKPSPNSSMSGSGDPKQVFRAKPRVSALTGRRTYTEDELHSALKDIISGKLGTRRAAVLYGIPRSTLRNKVYKIAMDQKRQASALHQPVLADLVDQDDEDKESGDDEKEDKLLSSSLDDQVDDLTRFTTSHLAAAALQKISKVCENNQVDVKPQIAMDSTHKHLQTTSQPQKPPITPHPWFDPNVILQSLLLRGIPGLMQPKEDQSAAIPELIKNFILQQQELIKEQMKTSASAATNDIMNNGKANIPDPRLLMQSLSMQQHGSQQHHIHTGHHYPNRTRNSETPEMSSSADMSETSDDPSVILKIPSYKPVAGSSSGKNGDGLCSPAPQATPPILSRSPHQPNSLPGISPPLIRHNSDSQSPPIIGGKGILSLGEVIAKSISRTFNQQANQESNLGTHQSVSEHNDQYKRPSISIKNLGIAEFGATPNILGNNSSNSSGSQGQSSSSVGGKGTRPKRGKYRNYDRDSLVEAVKAVQRGEMSVHRAGSYYGVPHSTLEYKVKERHLMRPRKREPKPQPLDDRATGCASSSTNSKNTNIPGIAGSIDKIKSAAVAQSKVHKNNPPFPSTSPNGMKVPMFESPMAAQLPYPTHLFWPSHSTGFGSLPIDFTRTPGGAPGAASSAATVGFPSNAENFLASHMMQRFHEDTNRHSANSSNLNSSNSSTAAVATATPTTLATTNNKAGHNNAAASSGKSTRELAESLYDTGGANGSFLDGIIRQTLERSTSNDAPHTVLLDQRVKTTRLPASGSDSSSSATVKGSKRSVSPMHFPVIDIKRERSSPNLNLSSSDAEISSRERDISQESVESLLKMRDGLTLKMEDKQLLHQQQQSLLHHHQNLHQHHVQQQQQQQQQSQPLHLHHQQSASSNSRHISLEDLNGSGCGLHEKLGQIKSEAEDSL